MTERTLDEPIEVVPYDPTWPTLFAAERERILRAPGLPSVLAIEHFGSTAVPGLSAKPIIDLLVGVVGWPPAPALRAGLSELGYEDLGEAGVPGRIHLRRRNEHAYNIALVAHGSALWTENLMVRDYLRARPDVRRDYASAKREAMNAGAVSLLAYSDHKAAFVQRLVRDAKSATRQAIAELRTERLLLRPWRDSDREPFAAMNADPRVMEHFPATLTPAESDAALERFRAHWADAGFGPWVVEVPGRASFAGFVGLLRPSFRAHFAPCVEIGWRLTPEHWGRGYTTEAARAVVRVAFSKLGLHEIVSFTVPANRRSLRIMEKLGMHHDAADDFDHPVLPDGHPLKRHLLYRLRRDPVAPDASSPTALSSSLPEC